MTTGLEVALFDFDGTIVDTEWTIYEEVLAIFKREGQHLPLEKYAQCIGSSYAEWSPQDAINEERNKRIRSRLASEGLMVGVIESLEATKKAGLRLAVVSSSSHEWVDSWLEKLGLEEYFDTVTCREDAEKIKPAPDLFLKGAERMNCAPEACLVIEDSRNGMLAAKAAGMSVVVVPNRITEVSDFSEADYRVSSLEEYPALFEGTVDRR